MLRFLLWAVLLVDSSWFNSVVHSFGYRLFILWLFIICRIVVFRGCVFVVGLVVVLSCLHCWWCLLRLLSCVECFVAW